MRILNSRTAAGLVAICGALLTPGLLASPPAAPADDASTDEEIEEAAALFRSSCSSCHVPPDPDHATDRAWLNQVSDTA